MELVQYFCTFSSFLYIYAMYKSRIKEGRAYFKGGLKFNWSEATQEQLKTVYDMGDNDYVEKVEDAAPKKKAEPKAKKSKVSSSKLADKE